MNCSDGLPTIGLAVIAKNEEKSLPKLLDSVEGYVDKIVVCDTGSEDDTVGVAKQAGCEVVEFEWVDDFSAARQESFDALGNVDFELWADCDDRIVGAEKLRHLAAALPPEAAGWMFRYDYARTPEGNCICELWRERLLRRGSGRWELPVHECYVVGQPIIPNNEVLWVHEQDPEKPRDPKRNFNILEKADRKARQDGKKDPRTLAYLGTELMSMGEWDRAIRCFEEYLELDPLEAGWDEERCQVSHKMSISLRAAERIDEAEKFALRAISERPDWADGYLDMAEISLRREDNEQALRWLDECKGKGRPQTLLIINPQDYEYQPMLMRSIALAKLGRVDEAMELTEAALAYTPDREDLLAQAATLHSERVLHQAELHLLKLREILVRHDENEKARKLMECAPYFVWERPLVAQARLDQREMTLHATDPEIYGRYYRENPNEAPFEAQGVPIEDAHKAFHRVKFLRDGLVEQATQAGDKLTDTAGLRILDLTCNDGWMLANLAVAGYGVCGALDGMDLNADAIERAKARDELMTNIAEEGSADLVRADLFTAAEHFEPHSYDAVVCFETVEHVPDPELLISLMGLMTKQGGRCYLSTPHGAFERGNLPQWYRVEQKGHLRALRAHDVAALVCESGIVEEFEIEQRLVVCSWRPQKRKGKVIFYAGGAEALPEKIITEGLGGSETALCKIAEQLARRSYDVRVYAGQGGGLRGDQVTTEGREPNNGQVLYASGYEWDPAEEADLFVCSRLPETFDRTIAADKLVLWLHDADYQDRLTPERVKRVDEILVMSQFQRELLIKQHSLPTSKMRLTRNGIEPSYFQRPKKERKPWVVYTSSPDRGLDVMLRLWPQIRERVPKAEFHFAYAPVYEQFRASYPHLRQFHRELERLQIDQDGLVNHGSLAQPELAKLYCKAKVWAYPSWTGWLNEPFPEISCIGAMEAQAAGLVCVFNQYGALRETIRDGIGIPMGAGKIDASWERQFVAAVVDVLTDAVADDPARRVDLQGNRRYALKLGWDGVAEQWEWHYLQEPDAEPVKELEAA